MNKTTPFIMALAFCAGSASVYAQKAGSFTLEFGITTLAPQVKSGDLSPPAFPNTKADVSDDTSFTGGVSYMLSDNIALNVPLGIGFKHDITGAARAQGFGKLATVKALPVTLFGQYRFGAANATVRPYVGAGLTYAYFYGEKGSAALTALTNPGGAPTTLSVKAQLVPSVQLGMIYNINEKWYLNGHYVKTFVTAKTKFSTGQTQNIKLNPDAFSVAVGYKF
jgi:outer membrane protein